MQASTEWAISSTCGFVGLPAPPHLESHPPVVAYFFVPFTITVTTFLGAFEKGAILHREFVNVVCEDGSVRIQKWAARFQGRQSPRIDVDVVRAGNMAKKRAVRGRGQ